MKNSMLKMAAKGAPMQKNYAGSPMHKDKRVKGDKHDDKQANETSNMSYTEETKNKAYAQLVKDEASLKAGNFKTTASSKEKNKKSDIDYSELQDRIKSNANINRAYRDQQKNLKAGFDSLGNRI